MQKLISVIIAAYNGQDYISQAIESVRAQDFPGEIEVVVDDDGSLDRTSEIARAFAGVRVVRQSNTGQSLARNHGVNLVGNRARSWLRWVQSPKWSPCFPLGSCTKLGAASPRRAATSVTGLASVSITPS